MSGATDSGMVKTMGIVMGCVGVVALVCVFAARLLSSGSDDYADPMKRNALVQRIQPVAAVRTSADDLPAAEGVTAMAEGPAKSAEELVNGACAACHVAGVAGAPTLDDEEAWAQRRESGLDALVASVINGKGAMPARGGSAYSDDEIRLAVQQIALFETTEEAPAESDDSAEAVTESEASEDDTAEADAASAEAETETAAAVQEPAAGDAVAQATTALVLGQVPEGLTDNIKATVDGVCAGCHLAGVAGAPKTGDAVAWQARADKGLEALTASVVNGLNVMPPRGGSTLTDEEIAIAIQYQLSQ